MAVRLELDLENTQRMLIAILTVIMKSDERVAFLCPAGTSKDILARIRVALSRKRKEMARKGKKTKHFVFRSTVHRETHNGKRYDCIVCWRHVSDSDYLMEQFEDIMTNG